MIITCLHDLVMACRATNALVTREKGDTYSSRTRKRQNAKWWPLNCCWIARFLSSFLPSFFSFLSFLSFFLYLWFSIFHRCVFVLVARSGHSLTESNDNNLSKNPSIAAELFALSLLGPSNGPRIFKESPKNPQKSLKILKNPFKKSSFWLAASPTVELHRIRPRKWPWWKVSRVHLPKVYLASTKRVMNSR